MRRQRREQAEGERGREMGKKIEEEMEKGVREEKTEEMG